MKLLFLDIDGVLVPNNKVHSTDRACQDLLPALNGCPCFSESCVGELNWLCAQSDVSIVVSSTWRQHIPSIDLMRSIFEQQGVSGSLVGMTPIAAGDWDSHDRGDEVKHYLAEQQVDSFVILDDLDMGWHGIEEYWVQPNGNDGLQRKDVEKALEILLADLP